MDEMTVKNRIIHAMDEPSVPERLVQSTIVRAQAVSAGRRAEERLEREEGKLSPEERTLLAAEGMIGRLALVSSLPEGVAVGQLTEQLASEPRFVRAVEKGNVLARLKNGELLQTAIHQPDGRKQSVPERNGPRRMMPNI